MLAGNMNPENLVVQARAKITWGEPPSSVRAFLTSNGVGGVEADQIVAELAAVRSAEIRKKGIKQICVGAALLLTASVFFYFSFRRLSLNQLDATGSRAFVGTSITIALGGFYGVFKLIDGIIHLFRPQLENQSLSEL